MLRACLAVVLLTCAVSPVLAQNGRGEACAPGSNGTSNRSPGTGTSAAKAKPPRSAPAAAPATSQGGGGEDDAVMRMRVPKWNSFLPGMFR